MGVFRLRTQVSQVWGGVRYVRDCNPILLHTFTILWYFVYIDSYYLHVYIIHGSIYEPASFQCQISTWKTLDLPWQLMVFWGLFTLVSFEQEDCLRSLSPVPHVSIFSHPQKDPKQKTASFGSKPPSTTFGPSTPCRAVLWQAARGTSSATVPPRPSPLSPGCRVRRSTWRGYGRRSRRWMTGGGWRDGADFWWGGWGRLNSVTFEIWAYYMCILCIYNIYILTDIHTLVHGKLCLLHDHLIFYWTLHVFNEWDYIL